MVFVVRGGKVLQSYDLVTQQGITFGQFQHFAEHQLKHGISTRMGGQSKGPFNSLNLGLHVHDESQAVITNRRRFCKAVNVPFDQTVTAEQVHGSEIMVATSDMAGKGMTKYEESICQSDALITNCPDLPLMLCFADCVPLLFYDPVKQAIGISHAGWKGTVGKIGQKTVAKMTQEFGTNPEDCLVGIGPSIGPCCYEIDEFVLIQFQKAFSWWARVVKPSGKKWSLNLWEANRQQLLDGGILPDHILVSQVCTASNLDQYFSYRAENGRTGRIAAIISL